MRCVKQGTCTHKLPSSMVKLCRPLLTYPMTVRIHIKLPYLPVLWLYLHLLGIPLFLFFSSTFPPCLCPLSGRPLNFLTVTCSHLSAGLGYDVGGLPSSSVPPYYSYCLCPSCSLFFLGLQMEMKLEFPLMFWMLPWIFLGKKSPS